jgi:hypothetical protein
MSTNSPQNIGNAPTEDPKDWTIMLYITADGTLTNFAVESLKQLNEAVSIPPKEKDASVIVAAHFSFPGDGTSPGDTTTPLSARAKAPANATPPEYIFEAPKSDPADSSKATGSKPVDRGLVLTLPPSTTVSKPATTPPEASTSDQARAPGQGSMSDQASTPPEDSSSCQASMSEKEALKAFLDGVYSNPKLKSKHYALILWGHGPELLLQPPEGNSTGDSNSLYLTPEELREVLTKIKPPTKDSKLDIIGFDACFMSMSEMAGELKGLADYMVASQDEVPDLSFPYACLVELFRKHGKNDLNSLLSGGVEAYVSTYQDCICNSTTGMNPVTLSALNLNNSDALKKAVKKLADVLVKAKNDPELQCVLIQARKDSQDYAGGLYVDLYEFCANLRKQLGKFDKTETWIQSIRAACRSVKTALEIAKNGDSLILANCSAVISSDTKKPQISCDPDKTTSHGISIYLPYLTDQQYTQVQRPLVKGTSGSHSGKGFTEALNGAGIEYLMSVRRDLILDTESYYPDLQFAKDTHWYNFISQVWTRALMKKVPADLDYHYSAQQSWMNVWREHIKGNNSDTHA